MGKMYQSEWQNIQFSDFAVLSSKHLAGEEFYKTFYEELFRRYRDWSQLSATWRRDKERCADKVIALSRPRSRILSVGCGLGYMERYIQSRVPELDLSIHEVAEEAWRWVAAEFAPERRVVGTIPDCLPSGGKYDLIYLCAVDYALDDEALVGLLSAIRPFLADAGPAKGQSLLISASFDETPASLGKLKMLDYRWLKALAAGVLDYLGLRPRGQFWGWARTQEEYHAIMRDAGYRDIEDGFVDPENRAHYWIVGC